MRFYYHVNTADLKCKLLARMDRKKISGVIKNDRLKFWMPDLYQAKESFPVIFAGRIVVHDDKTCIRGHFRLPFIPLILMTFIYTAVIYGMITDWDSGPSGFAVALLAIILLAMIVRFVLHRRKYIYFLTHLE